MANEKKPNKKTNHCPQNTTQTWTISSIVIHHTVQFHNNKVQKIECVIYWWRFLMLDRFAVDVSAFLTLGVSLHQRIVVCWLCRILEGTYNRKPVLKCTTGLFEFVVPSWFVRLHSRKIRVIYNKLKTTMEDRQLQLHQLLFSCNLLSTTPPELYRDIKIKWYLTQWYWERIKTASRFYEHIDKREIVNKAAVKLLLPNDQCEDIWFNTTNDLEFPNTTLRDTTTFTTYGTTLWIDNDQKLWNQFYNSTTIDPTLQST